MDILIRFRHSWAPTDTKTMSTRRKWSRAETEKNAELNEEGRARSGKKTVLVPRGAEQHDPIYYFENKSLGS